MLDKSTRRAAVALLGLQILNYLLPFALIPLLIRRLGLETFGVWALAMAIISVLRTIVAYGFDLSCARDIAKRPDDPDYAGRLVTTIVSLRLFGLLVFGALLVALVGQLGIPALTPTLMLWAALTLIGDAMAPVWLFHGRGDLALANTMRIVSRALLLLLVFLFVHDPQDLLLAPAIETATSLAYGIAALAVAYARYGLHPQPLSLTAVRQALGDGVHIFLSNASVHLYTTLNGILVGAWLGPTAFAHFTVAEKIYSGVRGLIQAAVQAVFPRLAQLSAGEPAAYRRAALRLLGIYLTVCFCAGAILFFGTDLAIRIVAGTSDPIAIASLRIFSVALLFAGGTVFSMLLIAQDKPQYLFAVTATSVTVNLLILWPLVAWLGATGAALAFLVSQIIQVIQHVWFNRRTLIGFPHSQDHRSERSKCAS